MELLVGQETDTGGEGRLQLTNMVVTAFSGK